LRPPSPRQASALQADHQRAPLRALRAGTRGGVELAHKDAAMTAFAWGMASGRSSDGIGFGLPMCLEGLPRVLTLEPLANLSHGPGVF
jgi:hypothetical protein